jgi:HSP20 family protein
MPANLWEKSFSKLTPSANIKENESTFTLDLAAPGLKKDDFKIEINNGVLTISAEKKEEKNEENDKFNRREFYYNSFSRSFTLPTNISENQIKASYENGLLKLIIPKLGTENNAKKIILQ